LFHRTESLDFGILLNGEVSWYIASLSAPPFDLFADIHSSYLCSHLDDGARVDMKPGDVCIQRGTIHGWTNHQDTPARLYFVLSGMIVIIASVIRGEDKLTAR
jgi:hypothetical protein